MPYIAMPYIAMPYIASYIQLKTLVVVVAVLVSSQFSNDFVHVFTQVSVDNDNIYASACTASDKHLHCAAA